MILKIDGVRVQRLTHNNNNNMSEERADGLTLWLVDGDGSWCALDCVRCEKTWRSSFVEIENEVHDGKCWCEWRDDGLGEVEWPSRWLRLRCWWFGGFDGVDGVDGAVGGLVASMASVVSMASMDWRRSSMVNWGLRHRGVSLACTEVACFQFEQLHENCAVPRPVCFYFSCLTVCMLPDVFPHSLFCLVMVVFF